MSTPGYHCNTKTWEGRILTTYGEEFLRQLGKDTKSIAVVGPSYGDELLDLRRVLQPDVSIFAFEINPEAAALAQTTAPPNTQIFHWDGYQIPSHPYVASQGIRFGAYFFNNNLLPAMTSGLSDDMLSEVIANIEAVAEPESKLLVSGNSTHFELQLTPDRYFLRTPTVYMGSAEVCSRRLWDALGVEPEHINLIQARDPQQVYALAK